VTGPLAAPANAPRRGHGDETRQALVVAAAEVFTAAGYRGATVSAIAEAAGFTKGAFYRHFPSKAAAYAEVFEVAAGEAWRVGTARVAEAETVAGAVAAYVDLVVAIYTRAPFRLDTKLEAVVEGGHDDELRRSTAEAFDRARRQLGTALERAAAREGVELRVPATDAARLLTAATLGGVAQWRLDPEAFDLASWSATTRAVVAAGLVTREAG
jgi:TetR/AcrR family transcriptional regulator, acrAB operon repressor